VALIIVVKPASSSVSRRSTNASVIDGPDFSARV